MDSSGNIHRVENPEMLKELQNKLGKMIMLSNSEAKELEKVPREKRAFELLEIREKKRARIRSVEKQNRIIIRNRRARAARKARRLNRN